MSGNKVCLVTGGAGFIGSHLCDALLGRGYKVIALDNLITGAEINLEQAKKSNQFVFKKQNVCENFEINDKVDFIFHLASPASVPDYQAHPLETARVNSIGTENLLNLAKRFKARFLFSSSSEVYGDPKEHPQKENYWGHVNPVGPRACYDESKRFAEMIIMIYHQLYNLDTRIVRIFNTYGPRMRKNDGRVISNFINQSITNSSVTVYGEGMQTRSFCYIDDMINGLVAMMESENVNGEIVNLGSIHEYKIIDLAKKIKKFVGSHSEIVFKTLPVDDPKERRPDLAKANTLLGWDPKIPFDDGLVKTIEYYRFS